ncbi:hypothetical protein BJ742DRAFT_855765, partial [Cladochytrium replicatum]
GICSGYLHVYGDVDVPHVAGFVCQSESHYGNTDSIGEESCAGARASRGGESRERAERELLGKLEAKKERRKKRLENLPTEPDAGESVTRINRKGSIPNKRRLSATAGVFGDSIFPSANVSAKEYAESGPYKDEGGGRKAIGQRHGYVVRSDLSTSRVRSSTASSIPSGANTFQKATYESDRVDVCISGDSALKHGVGVDLWRAVSSPVKHRFLTIPTAHRLVPATDADKFGTLLNDGPHAAGARALE